MNATGDEGFTQGLGASLRNEVIESQKIRIDLLKWKVILTAILGGAGLGLNWSNKPLPILFALIPPICLYVDMACSHIHRRIMMIGNWFQVWLKYADHAGNATPAERFIGGYEEFCDKLWVRHSGKGRSFWKRRCGRRKKHANCPSKESAAIRMFTLLTSGLLILLSVTILICVFIDSHTGVHFKILKIYSDAWWIFMAVAIGATSVYACVKTSENRKCDDHFMSRLHDIVNRKQMRYKWSEKLPGLEPRVTIR